MTLFCTGKTAIQHNGGGGTSNMFNWLICHMICGPVLCTRLWWNNWAFWAHNEREYGTLWSRADAINKPTDQRRRRLVLKVCKKWANLQVFFWRIAFNIKNDATHYQLVWADRQMRRFCRCSGGGGIHHEQICNGCIRIAQLYSADQKMSFMF